MTTIACSNSFLWLSVLIGLLTHSVGWIIFRFLFLLIDDLPRIILIITNIVLKVTTLHQHGRMIEFKIFIIHSLYCFLHFEGLRRWLKYIFCSFLLIFNLNLVSLLANCLQTLHKIIANCGVSKIDNFELSFVSKSCHWGRTDAIAVNYPRLTASILEGLRFLTHAKSSLQRQDS